MTIPSRKLGKTEARVTIMGLGGEGVLRTHGYEKETYDLINHAIDLGIGYFESARAYRRHITRCKTINGPRFHIFTFYSPC